MPPAADRRDAILAAARTLVLRHGLRGTSMEAIARTAGVAKPTLYAYFADKSVIFQALVEAVLAEWRSQILPILTGDGDVVERINHALVEKHRAVMTLLAQTPHADELWGEHDRSAAPQFAAFDQELADAVEAALTAAGAARARLLTQVLLAASAGIGRKAKNSAELGPAMRLVTERLLRPDLAP